MKFQSPAFPITCMLACLLNLTLQAEEAPPNILWIVAEDMSPDLGCYGNEVVSTPNIDGLAKKGMLFHKFFTTAPACSPSRTALATGVFQTTLGAHHMRYSQELMPKLPKPYKTLPQLMQERGYATGNVKAIGETGTGKDDWQFKIDGDKWNTDSWKELTAKQPFFAQINSKDSHRRFPSTEGIDQTKIKLPPYYPDHPVARNDWAGYLASIQRFDKQVGAILKQLENDGLADRTIVCLLSDHGRPMIRGKNWLYDSGTRVPLIIHIPEALKQPVGYKAGADSKQLISAIDLVAETVLMGGGEVPDWMQGRSFLRADSKPRSFIPTAMDRFGDVDARSRAIRTERYKYIRNYKTPGSINESTTAYRRAAHPVYHLLKILGDKGQLTPVQAELLKPMAQEELYDLQVDPHETVNLIGKPVYKDAHQKLKAQLDTWLKTSQDKGLGKDSDAIVEHFRQYGISTFKKRAASIEKLRAEVLSQIE